MNYIKLTLVLLITAVINLGCQATAPVINADTMKNEGLLIAHFGTRSSNDQGNVKINGQIYTRVINDNYLRLPLKPGKYQFEEVIEINRFYKQTNTVTLPVKFEFNIQAGEVTNIGEVVFYFPDANSNKYSVLFIDDSKQAAKALRVNHPDVYGALKSKTFSKAKVKYLADKNIKTLRTALLKKPVMISQYYAAGEVGALANLKRNKKGVITSANLIETDTYSSLGPCGQNGKRMACVVPGTSTGNKIAVTNGAKHKLHKLPANEDISVVALPSKKEVVLVSNKMKVFTSLDEGATWSVHDKPVLQKPLVGSYEPKISWAKNGYYVYSGGDDATLLYRKYNSVAKYTLIEPPSKGNKMGNIVTTQHGIYAGPEFTLFGKGTIFFQQNGKSNWIKRTLPVSECSSMRIADAKKGSVAVYCTYQYYISEDQGQTWRKAEKDEVKTTKL